MRGDGYREVVEIEGDFLTRRERDAMRLGNDVIEGRKERSLGIGVGLEASRSDGE